jgi:predicted DNA-binding protein (MmcQ/YjbR family)
MNKKHWNTIIVDGSVSFKLIKEWIDHSYELVKGKKKSKK